MIQILKYYQKLKFKTTEHLDLIGSNMWHCLFS